MAEGLAIWGAITGTIGTLTGVSALARAVIRERRERKLDLEVTHGWQFAYNEAGGLRDVWVCVTLVNKGRRPLHVQYVGFEAPVPGDRRVAEEAGVDLPEDNVVWTNLRFEISLGGESVEVAPDGPRVRIWTRLVPICRHSIDPTTTHVQAYAVTHHERYWRERPLPLLPQPVQPYRTVEEMGAAVAHLVHEEMGDDDWAPPPTQAGSVVGLQRIIVDGGVFHARASELLSGRVERDGTGSTPEDRAV